MKLNYAAEELTSEETTSATSFETTLQQKTFHENLVEKGVEAIKNSALEKVVLSRKQVLVVKTQPIEYFKRLLKNYPTAFVYCWYHPQVGLWLAATPETLVKTQNNRFKTMALAGTQVFEGTTDVSWGEKEKEEQAIVTRTIENALTNIKGIERLQISEVHTHRAGNVMHLKTDISGVFQKDSLAEIVTSLHPTPAVCGLPKQMAKEFILKEEAYDRAFYSGYVGELNIQVEKPRNPRKRNVENSAFNLIERQSNLYVILFSALLTIVLGGLLAATSVGLGPIQAKSVELDTKGQILAAVMEVPEGADVLALMVGVCVCRWTTLTGYV